MGTKRKRHRHKWVQVSTTIRPKGKRLVVVGRTCICDCGATRRDSL